MVEMPAKAGYCCKSPKRWSGHFSAEKRNKRQSSVDGASNPMLESPMSSACCDVVPHVIIQSSHVRLGEFESHAAKRLLQQYLPEAVVVHTSVLVELSDMTLGI